MTAIHIRPYRASDGPAFQAAVLESVTELHPWMPWAHEQYSLEAAEAWVRLQCAAFAEARELEFLVVDEDDRIVGDCGLNHIDRANRRANLGYWMRSSATGRGYATEAVRLVAEWAWAESDLERLEIVVAVGNHASLRVAEKAGAHHEGVLRSRLLLHDRFHDAHLLSLVRPS